MRRLTRFAGGLTPVTVALLSCYAQPAPDSAPARDKQTGTARDAGRIPPVHTSIVITASPSEPTVDRRDSEVFSRTLFGRDDQLLHVLGAGINAGQHEGGGKSLEIR